MANCCWRLQHQLVSLIAAQWVHIRPKLPVLKLGDSDTVCLNVRQHLRQQAGICTQAYAEKQPWWVLNTNNKIGLGRFEA